MSALFPSSFYRKIPGGFAGIARFGPFAETAPVGTAKGMIANAVRPIITPQRGSAFASPASSVRQTLMFEGVSRACRFPGVMQTERPATGAVTFPAAAGITDLSTLTISDGFSAFVWTFYRTTPFVAGTLHVNLNAAVTAADCAAAFAAATLLAFPVPGLGPAGFQARQAGALVRLIQASTPKTLQSAIPGANSQNLSWFSKTSGALGNGPIVPSVPGDWAAGSLVNMSGGKYRRPGVSGVVANRQRALFVCFYYPAISEPE